MATVLEQITRVIAKTTSTQLSVLENILGFPAKIYYPVQYGSLLDQDAEITYNNTPDLEANILLASIYNSAFLSPTDSSLEEAFSQDEVVWFLSGKKEPPPLNSKVEITINNKTLAFQVSHIKEDPTRAGAYYEIYLTSMR